MRKITIDTETADKITVCTLKDYRKVLKKELSAYKKDDWVHDADIAHNTRKIKYITEILKDFGCKE